jgi:hypothetical protein
MKIIELIKLTETKPLKEIAKEEAKHLSGFEKKVRTIFKEIGVIPKGTGKSGWNVENADPGKLQLDVGSFEVFKPRTAKTIKKERTEEEINVSRETTKEKTYDKIKEQDIKPTKEEKPKVRKRASFDIDKDVLKRLRMYAIQEEKNTYELVEKAIVQFLEDVKK